MDLAELLTRPEGKTLEFKRDLSSPEGMLRTLVAFANTAGGVVLIGVEDSTRRVRGVRDALELEERVANLVSDSIVPRLLPDIELLSFRQTHVLAVQAHPSPLRPHFLQREGLDRGTYVRVGSTNRRADKELIDELQRFKRGESYDAQPMPDSSSEAIDFLAASESFSEFRALKRRDYETLQLLVDHQGRKVPTVGGMVLFGKERLREFPDAWIQVGRFGGTDKTRIVDHAELRGYPVQATHAALQFVEKHALLGAEIGPARRIDRWNLPPIAVREAVINAIVHADYAQRGAPIRISIFDDRLEIENPGLLPFGLTLEDLPQGVSKLRNRVIARVFHELRLVELWGSGIHRMISACREAGIAAPEFLETGTRFRVTLRSARVSALELAPTDQRILDCLAKGDGLSTQEIARGIKLTPRATRTRLRRLVENGVVSEIGSSPKDPRRRYFLMTK